MEFKIGNETYKLLVPGFQFRFGGSIVQHNLDTLPRLVKNQEKPQNQAMLKALLEKSPELFQKVEKTQVSSKK